MLGLTWDYVEFAASEFYVRQRADRYNDIGSPKSVSWLRAVPMTPIGANPLNGWKLECPNGELNLVFSNTSLVLVIIYRMEDMMMHLLFLQASNPVATTVDTRYVNAYGTTRDEIGPARLSRL